MKKGITRGAHNTSTCTLTNAIDESPVSAHLKVPERPIPSNAAQLLQCGISLLRRSQPRQRVAIHYMGIARTGPVRDRQPRRLSIDTARRKGCFSGANTWRPIYGIDTDPESLRHEPFQQRTYESVTTKNHSTLPGGLASASEEIP